MLCMCTSTVVRLTTKGFSKTYIGSSRNFYWFFEKLLLLLSETSITFFPSKDVVTSFFLNYSYYILPIKLLLAPLPL